MRSLASLRELLKAANAPQREWNEALRQEIRQRDRGICMFCGAPGVEVHHVVPRGKGGDKRCNNPANLILVCRLCHDMLEKRNKDVGWLVIQAYDPDDPQHGLVVKFRSSEGDDSQMPKRDLAFYWGRRSNAVGVSGVSGGD